MKKNNNDHINQIQCDAYNCVYNDGTHACLAEQVKVGKDNAKQCTDTLCSTFKLDQNAIK